MDVSTTIDRFDATLTSAKKNRLLFLRFFLCGLLLPLSFAPFHIPGIAVLSLALFYHQLTVNHQRYAFFHGLAFGLGFFGLGISWIIVSIHEYGHLNYFLSLLITSLFILYLSMFPALMAYLFCRGTKKTFSIFSCVAFSALWIISEYSRAAFLTGFPWLLIGFGQFDAPTKYLLPVVGVYGIGFITCFIASLLVLGFKNQGIKRFNYLAVALALLLAPTLIKGKKWVDMDVSPVSVGIIQANMSMRDKWDETLFWQLLKRYRQDAEQLLGTQLIVMPESAIPLPARYISDFLEELQQQAKKSGSAIMLGIPQETTMDEEHYFNALITLGQARGSYLKQHLVPFGEYIPKALIPITNWLDIPDANLQPGKARQTLITVHQHPVASLICYELAYGSILRQQLPEAQWIVSISDDGWFGRSLAVYQQQQMAQVRSLQSSRYQVVANNDGLSSVINNEGDIVSSLPAFSSGVLKAALYPMTGSTPWVITGDAPILLISALICLLYLLNKQTKQKDSPETIAAEHKRRYPYQPV